MLVSIFRYLKEFQKFSEDYSDLVLNLHYEEVKKVIIAYQKKKKKKKKKIELCHFGD